MTMYQINKIFNIINGFIQPTLRRRRFFNTVLPAVFFAACVLAFPPVFRAQSATVYGQLGNFDVINHTGHDGHGFEIEIEGVHPEDIYYSFSAQRYGAPVIAATATGTRVRWTSPYINGAFTQTTLPHAPNTPFAGSCYQWGANYNQSACEHFGVSLTATPTHTTYRWLVEDTANPGTLVGVDPPIAVVAPVYVINPPAVQGGAPELVDVIDAPEPAEAPELYGDAQWVKVFKVQLNREANLDELVSDNAVVPQDAAHLEVAWEIVQQEPASGSNSNGNRRQRRHSEPLNADTRAVIRRYETYAFTGQYDPVTHEALCADATCNTAAAGEVGELIGAQMTAANISVASVSVSKTGNGSVNSSDSLIDCGSKCAAIYDNGAAVTLTASPATNYLFTGWSGACAGNLPVCTVSAAQSLRVTANFARPVDVSAKTSGGKGSVVAPAAGINCGKTCSSKVAAGTSATFTATPETGFRFVNWSGACSGASRTCTVTISNSTSVQANFAK